MALHGTRWIALALAAACAEPPPEERATAPASTAVAGREEGSEEAASESQAAPAVSDAESSEALVSFGLATRDHELWLHYGAEADHYTVKSKDGRVLADRIDEARLQLSYPELHELLHGGVDTLGVDVIDD